MENEKGNGEFPEQDNTPSKTESTSLSERFKEIVEKPVPSPMSNFASLIR